MIIIIYYYQLTMMITILNLTYVAKVTCLIIQLNYQLSLLLFLIIIAK